MYQHILVAVDLSAADGEVLSAAGALAQRFASRLSVLHVVEAPVTGYGRATAQHHIANANHLKQQHYPRLRQLMKGGAFTDVQLQQLVGRPAEVIHHYAIEHECDLIVVGSHGYAGLKALLGSTAHQVLHGANCDILTVRINQ